MNNKSDAFECLKKYIINNDGKQVWIGGNALFNCDSLLVNNGTNYRLDKKHHQEYNVVWMIEDNIFEKHTHSWLLLIDEALRLFSGKKGILAIRTCDNKYGTLFSLKSFLDRNVNINTKLLEQIKCQNSNISVFEIHRNNLEIYRNIDWTFGILSNGFKNVNVIQLIDKIISLNHVGKIEFIISGPKIKELSSYENVKFICEKMDELPRISEKKNKIVCAAIYENIVIFHDRYQVDENYFRGFDVFGYDFDFLTIRQLYPSGNEFPSYLKFAINEKTWQTPIVIQKYDEVSSSSFINGGLIIIKKKTALKINFNSLLLHNEAEDVEFAMQMHINGIVPRINTISTAYTIGIDEKYTSSFIFRKNHIRKNIDVYVLKTWFLLPPLIRNTIKKFKIYEKAKNIYHSR